MIRVGVLHFEAWPRHHQILWEAGIRPPLLPSDPCGAGAKWRQDTLDIIISAWGRYCFYLLEMGWLDPSLSPGLLFGRDRVFAYLRHLREHNKPSTILTRIVGLERALAVLAPELDRALLYRLISELKAHYIPISKRERLQESAALIELGFALMARARASVDRKRRNAALYRDGLQIALLAYRPIRLRNLSSMRIERHLKRSGRGWRVEFEGPEVKNDFPLEFDLPTALVPALDHYLDGAGPRRMLCGDRYQSNGLWVSHWWQQQDHNSIYGRLCKRTSDLFGLPITPHLFRDCAATSLALHDPEEVGLAHLILGNRLETCQKYYNLARALDASRVIQLAQDQRRRQRD